MSKLTPREILTASAVVPVMAIDDLSTAVDLSHAPCRRRHPHPRNYPAHPRRPRRHPPDCQRSAQCHRRRRYGNQSRTAQSRRRCRRGFRHQPGLHESLAKASHNSGIPLIPGVATPGEVQLALEHGIDTLKLFPAEVVGGKAMLKPCTALTPMFASARPAASAWQLHPNTWHYLMYCASAAHG